MFLFSVSFATSENIYVKVCSWVLFVPDVHYGLVRGDDVALCLGAPCWDIQGCCEVSICDIHNEVEVSFVLWEDNNCGRPFDLLCVYHIIIDCHTILASSEKIIIMP